MLFSELRRYLWFKISYTLNRNDIRNIVAYFLHHTIYPYNTYASKMDYSWIQSYIYKYLKYWKYYFVPHENDWSLFTFSYQPLVILYPHYYFLPNIFNGFIVPTTLEAKPPTKFPPMLNPEENINFVIQAVTEIVEMNFN